MELIASYLHIHKKVHPILQAFLGDQKLLPYQQKMMEAMNKSSGVSSLRPMRWARGSGKTGAQMEYMRAMLGHMHNEPVEPIPFRVSDELLDDSMDIRSNLITEAGRAMARRLEASIFDSIRDIQPMVLHEPPTIEFLNGSRIQHMHSDFSSFDSAVRGPGVHFFVDDEGVHAMPSISEFRGDRDGDYD
jgi:hypothetical protein